MPLSRIPTLPADTGYAIAQEPLPLGLDARCHTCARPLRAVAGTLVTVSPRITTEGEPPWFCSLECAVRAIFRIEWLRRVKAPTC